MKTLRSDLREVKILVDSGSTNNYINSNLRLGNRTKLDNPSIAKTLHGVSKVEYGQKIRMLNQNLDFIELDSLKDFDMILGEKSLREMKAQLFISKRKKFRFATISEKRTGNRYSTNKFHK